MKTQLEIFNLPKIQRLELFALVSVTGKAFNEVVGFRDLVLQETGISTSGKFKPHISIGLSKATDKNLDEEIEHFCKRLSEKRRFEIVLRDFDIFENPQNCTLYVKVVNPTSLQDIFHCLYATKTQFNPHVTIVKAMPLHLSKRVRQICENKSYETKITCDHIRILKRPYKSNDDWEFVADIPLL